MERACHAARFLLRSLSRMRRQGLAADAGLGLHVGEVVLSGSEGDWSCLPRGDALKLARRLALAAEPGQVLVSFRTLSAIGLIDLDKEQMVWAQRGFWIAQHDPDPLPDGRILIYDNRGHAGSGGCSRILEFEPVTHAASWTYTGVEQQPFESKIRGAQQRLPNGNVLITESVGGRIFEVSREKEIVWDYHTPERLTEGGEEFTAVVCGARRFSGDELEFLSDRNNTSAGKEGDQ